MNLVVSNTICFDFQFRSRPQGVTIVDRYVLMTMAAKYIDYYNVYHLG